MRKNYFYRTMLLLCCFSIVGCKTKQNSKVSNPITVSSAMTTTIPESSTSTVVTSQTTPQAALLPVYGPEKPQSLQETTPTITSTTILIEPYPQAEIEEATKKIDTIFATMKKKDDYSQELSSIEDAGKAASPKLKQIFADSRIEWHKRWMAAMGLGRLRGAGAKESLLAGLKDELSVIRMAAITALKRFPEDDVVVALHEAFQKDNSMLVRNTALEILTEIRDPKSVSVLAQGLSSIDNFYKGRNLWIRNNIVNSLGKFKSKETVPILIDILNKKDLELYEAAFNSLGSLVTLQPDEEPLKVADADKKLAWWLAWWEKHKSEYSNPNLSTGQ
jgi:hypothetical protein